MKILVTGAKGFIGSCLTSLATTFGNEVIAVDDLSRGLNDVQSVKEAKFIPFDCREGIAPILDEEFIKKEIASLKVGSERVETTYQPVDVVVHLAAGTGSLSRPYEELVELNVEMTKRIYRDCVEKGVKVFVFPTTSLVEGCPDAPYVKSKQDAMDWLCAQNDDIKLVPLQFYNVTGAYNGFSEHRKLEVHIVPVMLEKFMNKAPFIINGDTYDTVDGTPGRDFSNVRDVCTSILQLAAIQVSQTPFKINKPIKLGTGVITTTLQMIKLFNEYMSPRFGRELDWEIGPIRPYDCGWLRCDQPYLHILTFGYPAPIRLSLYEELGALLKVVYNVN